MKRTPLYSSRRAADTSGGVDGKSPAETVAAGADRVAGSSPTPVLVNAPEPLTAAADSRGARWRRRAASPAALWLGMSVLAALLALNLLNPGMGARPLTQKAIEIGRAHV